MAENSWTRPSDGKVVVWKPLTVGVIMDLEALYRADTSKHMLKYGRLARRVVSIDGVKKDTTATDLREWDEADLDDFFENVQTQEAVRAAGFRKKLGGGDALAMLESAVERVGLAMMEFNAALRDAVEQARAAQAGDGPLKQG